MTDRYAIYTVNDRATVYADPSHPDAKTNRRLLAETSRDGLGLALTTLRDEGQITNGSRVGILDRQTRTWVVNPFTAAAS